MILDSVHFGYLATLDGLPDRGRGLNGYQYLALISKYGISQKGFLEKLWAKTRALSHESIIAALLNEDVISKVRVVLNKNSSAQLTNNEVQEAIEKFLQIS